jgi:hypothetical protein
MQDVIWMGRPGAGDSAAIDQIFENVRFADACSTCVIVQLRSRKPGFEVSIADIV